MDDTPYAVEMLDIVMRFPGVLANDHVNFRVRQGEIHALLGENGAGKSTLMNVLSGLYQPTEGIIKIYGTPVRFGSPKDAIAKGIGMVHQHFMLVPTLTVTENILMGLDKPRFIMDMKKLNQEILDLQEKYGLRVDPDAQIWQLSVGEQQRVEILKTLYRGANILILDEPTAVLAPQEIEELMQTLRALVAQGKSIVFITHKLQEVEMVADRITVLRKGVVTAEGIDITGLDRRKLAQLMVGRDVVFSVQKSQREPGDVVLEVKDLKALNNKGVPALRGVSLQIRQGEILGIAGVSGNGQSELAECITGLRPAQGSIRINGKEMINAPPAKIIKANVSHIPEDRTRLGSAPNLSITDNTIMKCYYEEPVGNGITINRRQARQFARGLKQAYDILAPSVRTLARKLSGGNLQKMILARELAAEPALIVAVQPTRGLDVGAIEAIQRLLLAQREAGAAILLISEELEELLTLSDRIVVMYEGEIMGEVDPATADVYVIGQMMTGARIQDTQASTELQHASAN